eukprot:GHVN01073740.1.p1 GENE.GHVN01073740.1~~GHVN01073740.1.p1  ORF type:complete len:123 (+),score=1.71 GHVN01073740.1:416-784(+)
MPIVFEALLWIGNQSLKHEKIDYTTFPRLCLFSDMMTQSDENFKPFDCVKICLGVVVLIICKMQVVSKCWCEGSLKPPGKHSPPGKYGYSWFTATQIEYKPICNQYFFEQNVTIHTNNATMR